MNVPLTIEQLELALSIPSFEEELAMSDLPHGISPEISRVAKFVTCRTCGARVLLGPGEHFTCPREPHDPEDEYFGIDNFDEKLEAQLYKF